MVRQSVRQGRSSRRGDSVREVAVALGRAARDRLPTLALLAVLLAVQWADPAPVEILRTRAFDLYQHVRPRPTPPETPVVVADIDEASLAAYGQWPWPRTLVAQLVLALNAAGAAVIGFDVVFAEGDRTSPEYASRFMAGLDDETFEKLQALPRNDDVLASQIAAAPVVLGQAAAAVAQPDRADAGPRSSVNTIGEVGVFLPRYPALLRNLPALEAAARGSGVFSLLSESDGIVRRIPAAVAVGDSVFPTLAVEALRVAVGTPSVDIRAGPGRGVHALRVAPHVIPTDPMGRIWVYFAPRDTARTYSIHDILTGTVGASELAGRIVLVGTSAAGLLDMRATPLEGVVPGVEIHAQALDMILAGDYLVRPAWARSAELLCTLLAGLLILLGVRRVGALAALAAGAAVAGGIAANSWLLFAERGVLFDGTWSVLAAVTTLGVVLFRGYFREQTEKRRIRGAFSHYLSPALVERLANDPAAVRLGGETREMTILFCDIRDFTTISERHKDDPERLTALVNELLTPLSRAVLDHGGTIDKYIGDCVMAFWNAPVADTGHAGNALRAAAAMGRAVVEVNARRAAADGAEPLRIGVGVNTGRVVVGNMGSEMRFDYSVLGDAVNLAARLEGQSKVYGVDIVVGEQTAAAVGEALPLLELDLIAVQGKSEGVRIYTLTADGGAGGDWQGSRQRNAEMLAAYREQRWDDAALLGRELRETPGMPGAYYAMMLARVAAFRADPPPSDWRGIHVAVGK